MSHLYESIGALTLHCLRLFPTRVQDAKLELGAHFALLALHQQQVERQVVLAFLVQTLGVDAQAPFQLVVGTGGERAAFQHLAHLLATKA